MRFSRGPIRSTKTDMKSICIALKARRIQGAPFMQALVVEAHFVSYLPIRNELLGLAIRKVRDGGGKWRLGRANPIDKTRYFCIGTFISYRFLPCSAEVGAKNGLEWGCRGASNAKNLPTRNGMAIPPDSLSVFGANRGPKAAQKCRKMQPKFNKKLTKN